MTSQQPSEMVVASIYCDFLNIFSIVLMRFKMRKQQASPWLTSSFKTGAISETFKVGIRVAFWFLHFREFIRASLCPASSRSQSWGTISKVPELYPSR